MTNYDSHGQYIGTGFWEEKHLHTNAHEVVNGEWLPVEESKKCSRVGTMEINSPCPLCDGFNENCGRYTLSEVENLKVKTGIEYVKEDNSVKHPNHYNQGDIEVIDYIHDQRLGFNLGNAIKYISRAGRKSDNKHIEDLEKAIFYINDEIERIKGESPRYIKQRGMK